jgi:hypothetical protein
LTRSSAKKQADQLLFEFSLKINNVKLKNLSRILRRVFG